MHQKKRQRKGARPLAASAGMPWPYVPCRCECNKNTRSAAFIWTLSGVDTHCAELCTISTASPSGHSARHTARICLAMDINAFAFTTCEKCLGVLGVFVSAVERRAFGCWTLHFMHLHEYIKLLCVKISLYYIIQTPDCLH